MKLKIVLLMSSIALTSFATEHTYQAYGQDEHGDTLSGALYVNNGDDDVTGELIYDNGDVVEFDGQRVADDEYSGQTQDGVQVNLYIKEKGCERTDITPDEEEVTCTM